MIPKLKREVRELKQEQLRRNNMRAPGALVRKSTRGVSIKPISRFNQTSTTPSRTNNRWG